MIAVQPLKEADVPGFKLFGRGKVRDSYDLENGKLMIISTDRFSAFDVILEDPIYPRGAILNRLSHHWFTNVPASAMGPHHCISINPADFPPAFQQFGGRAMLVWKADEVFPVECIARGYLEGSAYTACKETGKICGIELPKGLKRGDKLPEPIFTPSTKATTGHDENITFERMCEIVGDTVANVLRAKTLAIYKKAHEIAMNRANIIVADTKFEFGRRGGLILLVDEVLTPDSSRFWPKEHWCPGQAQLSYDKQFVRDYLQGLCDQKLWNKKAPAPRLPAEVIEKTRQKYVDAYTLLTGKELPEASAA